MAKEVHPYVETDALRGCAAPFLLLWLCWWAVGEYMLVATLCGADMPWANREVPPLWSLIILTAFWTAAGAYAVRKLYRIVRGRER